jgi:uncharacterized damage-inducible protein DinB
MNVDDIRKLYAYTDWANGRIIDAIAVLSDEQYAREITSSFSSIRDTLSHIASSEWIWLKRWKGTSPREVPEWAIEPLLATSRDRIHRIASARRAFLESLSDDLLRSKLSYTNLAGEPFVMPLEEVLIHCANHSTHHRGQLTTMLRQIGATPPNTDYAPFYRSIA